MKHYPYRFKTKKEFEEELGSYWSQRVKYNWNSPYMDTLFGEEFPYTLDELDLYNHERPIPGVFRHKDGFVSCNVSWEMLTKNIPKVPNYKPKKRLLESLDIDKSEYFRKYNTIIFSVLEGVNFDEIRVFIWEVRKLIDIDVSSTIRFLNRMADDGDDHYFRITKNKDGFDTSYGSLMNLENQTIERKLTYSKLYTFDEIKTNIRNIIIGKPNYTPKRKRLLESVNRRYQTINIEIPNEEESKRYQELLFNNNIYWCDGQNTYFDVGVYPIWFTVDFIENYITIYYEKDSAESEGNIISYLDYSNITSIIKYGDITPSYKPKKFLKESINNKVLNAFDMDDTLVYSKRFEEHVKPLLTEFLNPEIILKSKINDIGINIEDLKYENGRIYFEDPEQLTNIPNNSSWVRKKDRIYITQPDAYFMTEESMPIGTYSEIIKLYEESEYKAIITARNERLRGQTELALNNLGIEKPNCGLFMYPENNFSLKVRWKIDKLMELIHNENFTEVHYFDDNIKILKKMKEYFDKQEINISLYKVTENKYRKI